MYVYVHTQIRQLNSKYQSFIRKYQKKVLIFLLVFQASQQKLFTKFSMHYQVVVSSQMRFFLQISVPDRNFIGAGCLFGEGTGMWKKSDSFSLFMVDT